LPHAELPNPRVAGSDRIVDQSEIDPTIRAGYLFNNSSRIVPSGFSSPWT
jgi:hypothetical protein